MNQATEVSGLQIAGILNEAAAETEPSQPVETIQIAGLINVAGALNGYQLSLVGNDVKTSLVGLQVAGLFNWADRVRGIEIGLINVCREMSGIQIGLINIIREGPLPFSPIVNASFSF